MGLEVMSFPDALHARTTDPLGFGHGTNTPMGGLFGSTAQGGLHNRGFVLRRNLSGPTGARSIFQNSRQPFLLITPRQSKTVGSVVDSWRASTLFAIPSAARRTICTRSATDCGVLLNLLT